MTTLTDLDGDCTFIEETYNNGRIEWSSNDGITTPTIVWSDNMRFHMSLLDDDETFDDDCTNTDTPFTQAVEIKLQRLLGTEYDCCVQWSDMDDDVDNEGEEYETRFPWIEYTVWRKDDSVFTPEMEEEDAYDYLWPAIATLFNVTDPGTWNCEYLYAGLARKKAMNAARIAYLRQELEDECISMFELQEIQNAFDLLDPATLRDLPENAMASDMLDELESAL